VVDGAVETLNRAGIATEPCVLSGPVVPELVRTAIAMPADLIVVGSHGRGRIAGLVLGSVASGLVDDAPCPVLIGRRPTARTVLVAVDGSSSAAAAVASLTSLEVFRSLTAVTLTVARPLEAPLTLLPETEEELDDLEQLRHAQAESAAAVAETAAAALRAEGMNATSRVAFGNPTEEILATARDLDVDLIVLGTRGLRGFERLRVGSTARGVLGHAAASVLVVPPPRS
jgi:nucleotide-binding universal stress UspA family protein